LFASIFFFLTGQPFIARLGIQNDEALFATPVFEPRVALYSIHIGSFQIPLMQMSYLGCLKAFLYRPVFRLFGVGAYAVREPALIMGAASIWLFFLLLRQTAGLRAACIGCCLLAADSTYLLTTCFDWGPVALQHLLVVGGVFLLVRFYQTKAIAWLAAGFFLLGLALWDKALAMWMLGGLGIAGILVFPRQIFAVTGFRRAAISLTALTLGALPLVVYNLHTNLATLRDNTQWDTSEFSLKAHVLGETARGRALLGYFNAVDQDTPRPQHPAGILQKFSAALATIDGNPTSGWMLYAFFAAVLLSPLAGWNGLRTLAFFLIAMAVAWIQMAVNPHTGGSAHHTILLWPWPQAVIAISLAGVSRKMGRFGIPAVAAVVALVCVSCLLVTNEYYTKMVRNGGVPTWSAAIFSLADTLRQTGAARVFCTDWGIFDSILLLDRNRPEVMNGIGTEKSLPDLQWALSDPNNLFVGHTREAESFVGVNENLVEAAEKLGYRQDAIQTIADGYGRNIFTVYRFR
jgi:Dolichyl-phosphate-mannose-protein mannosyltransferase